MHQPATALQSVIDQVRPLLAAIPDEEAAAKPAPDKWSAKEIIGHLIDSAANNHQRFVRAQAGVFDLSPYKYRQEYWVAIQNYATEDWTTVIELWYAYNRHLCHVIRHIPDEAGLFDLVMGPNEKVTLRFLVEDYISHLVHHLKAIPNLL